MHINNKTPYFSEGLSGAALGGPEGVVLRLPVPLNCEDICRCRVFAGSEFHSRGSLVLKDVKSGLELGRCEVSYTCQFQPFYIDFKNAPSGDIEVSLVLKEDSDRLSSQSSFWVFTGDPFENCFAPAFLTGAEETRSEQNLLEAHTGPWGLQPFNWIYGCVVDGLSDQMLVQPSESLFSGIRKQISWFFSEKGSLEYTGPHSEKRENELFGIEQLLCFIPLLRFIPDHPGIRIFDEFCKKHLGPDGLIMDRGVDAEGLILEDYFVSVEGFYTLAYPLALRAGQLNDLSLMKTAVDQIRLRLPYVLKEGIVYQKSSISGHFYQPYWARAYCWFLLGLVKTIALARKDMGCQYLIEAFQSVAASVLDTFKEDGLFPVYFYEPETLADTSGCAGIGAAFALGYREGLLGKEYLDCARLVERALSKQINQDGFLCGASQLNRGTPDFQKEEFRVCAQFGGGLYLQLTAALSGIRIKENQNDGT
ncbi:glycoside hydrolase family 88 protein [Oceanispirochaeta sp.]|jgi:hypothetical protein|uniref:glycoside hydrolase family 88 protein n=1 Tax=Oceanispirochaeta sp. TaxID=2035350 RepID=UPI0026140CA0|nr:glycoside hydrolase family 88 protein [Oceanispirochaeta sp.]MDA3955129.1 glycoside hydrolase family 88 protein [Oceanispirochaeta sp.]